MTHLPFTDPTDTSRRHWTYQLPSGYVSFLRWVAADLAYAAAFSHTEQFTADVSTDGLTWYTLTWPQFVRLVQRLRSVSSLDEIAALVAAETWSEGDLFGDLLSEGPAVTGPDIERGSRR